ncbi:MAG: hypothetical protein LBD04_07975 [Synergistaceae bacterium]|jgi:hypothetical protein|nr:hypothetical protein [Synergistaceae bacterium]
MADEKRMKEVFSDEAFVKSLLTLETPEEVKAELKKKGVDLTVDEILSIRETLVKKAEGKELTEEDLEKVAGGSVVGIAIGIGGLLIGAGSFVNDLTRGRW